MRKNKMMRAASALLVAVLLTTSTISGTFAKYVTEASGEDTARVAKWGVEVSASGTMFGKAYQDTIVEDGVSSATVQSNHNGSFAKNVVAPGTKNDTGIQIAVVGKPEVDFTVKAEVKNLNFKNALIKIDSDVKTAISELAERFAEYKKLIVAGEPLSKKEQKELKEENEIRG